MWQASITEKTFVNGVLLVKVTFTDGNTTFVQSMDMTGGSADILAQRIANQLNTLNTSASLFDAVVTGDVAAIEPVDNPIDANPAVSSAIANLEACKRAVDLGVITMDDPIYIAALDAVKSNAIDQAFLNQL